MRSYDKIPNVWKHDTGSNLHHSEWEWADPVVKHLADTPWTATEKLDGTNIRIGLDEYGSFFVKGRTDKAMIPPSLLSHCQSLEGSVRGAFDVDPRNICLYGEGVGRGIQKEGGRYSEEQRFVLFDCLIGGWWLTRDSLAEIGRKALIPTAPVIHDEITIFDAVEEWVQKPQPSAIHGGPCEGWVLRPVDDLLGRDRIPIRVKLKERDVAKARVK